MHSPSHNSDDDSHITVPTVHGDLSEECSDESSWNTVSSDCIDSRCSVRSCDDVHMCDDIFYLYFCNACTVVF